MPAKEHGQQYKLINQTVHSQNFLTLEPCKHLNECDFEELVAQNRTNTYQLNADKLSQFDLLFDVFSYQMNGMG